MNKKIIGSVESIDLLDLDLFDLDAKIDTGADSSALHCDDIHVDEANNIVSFRLLDKVHPSYHNKKMSFNIYKMKKVKSSNGKSELRPSIKVNANFFDKKYPIILSLTDRSDMKYPMLIGRKFLAKRFLVDVSLKYMSKKEK
ncbi:ATP-dependent zinc protease [Sulfurospirillum sp. 1307]|jgi:hypothetical protein